MFSVIYWIIPHFVFNICVCKSAISTHNTNNKIKPNSYLTFRRYVSFIHISLIRPHNTEWPTRSYEPFCRHHFNTLGPRQNGRHFVDGIFKCIFVNKNIWIANKISLKFVSKAWINNIPALVPIMACCRLGDKSLSEPVMVGLLTHICVTWPQWVVLYWMKPSIFWLKCHRSLFLRGQLTLSHYWFRWWLGAEQMPSHYLNLAWSILLRHICISRHGCVTCSLCYALVLCILC